MSAYLNPPTDMQSPKAISMCTMSRYLYGEQLIGLPQGTFGMVVYALIDAGNSPLSINTPSFVVATKCL
jgi:hypothetical protein